MADIDNIIKLRTELKRLNKRRLEESLTRSAGAQAMLAWYMDVLTQPEHNDEKLAFERMVVEAHRCLNKDRAERHAGALTVLEVLALYFKTKCGWQEGCRECSW